MVWRAAKVERLTGSNRVTVFTGRSSQPLFEDAVDLC